MKRQCGMTLVELVIAIVIVGIAAAALYSAMASIGGRSADPMLRQQSLAVAEAYLEEILARDFLDPASHAQCPAPPVARADFDNVCDYAGLDDAGAHGADGAPIAGLQGYRVRVAVAPQVFNGLSTAAALQVVVTVEAPDGQQLTLSGWRTCYGEHDGTGAYACVP
ncbi:prepilin-type N-terminal cleavage/methylation domain-containing protein [Pseudomonas sp. A-1]|uniref:type IV pilus modification PilV family protein n=1 Tax=Pseudomonas sp. A-1 TaxID=1821274 RepID=UPI002113F171|nr:prepilin-type N-terminal cleavage/methylation domain-containing protein [Pseudomonas sp. A-1]